MSTSPPTQSRRSAGDAKKTPPSSIVTRNGAKNAKIQTRSMLKPNVKPSPALLAAKKKAQQKKKTAFDTVLKDHYQIAMECKSKVKGPTGFVTEPRMTEHRCLWDENYPENPERLISVIKRCEELKLIEECKQFPPRLATKEELMTLHSPEVYDLLLKTHENNDVEYLEDVSSKYDAIYIHPSTHSLALLAAGSTIDMVDRVVTGEVQTGVAFVRPPGHHAMRAEPCGYCFYNNVALAAHHAVHKRGLERVLIVDWDVHHGQATQQMFYDDPRVLYFSIHRYEHGSFWPNLRQSDFPYVGSGAGAGRNVNVPLNETGATDADYLAIWHQLLLPMALEYSPQLIIISAGFDAALGDEKGEMEVTPACYGHLTRALLAVCGAVVAVLEGGYCLASLAEGAAHTLRALLRPPPPLPPLAPPSHTIRETILNCIYAHKKYWRCFNYQPTYSIHSSVQNVCDERREKHTVTVKWLGDETRPERFATRDCYPLQDDTTKRNIKERLEHLKQVMDLSIPEHDVGYIYDEAMLKHKNICEPDHVECPERILRVHERLRDFGLLERLHRLPTRTATDREILTVHTKEHLQRLKDLSSTKLRDLNSAKGQFDSVYFHPDSFESAAVAAGCVLQMVDAVLSGVCGAGVCAVRPPGHHADAATPSGFCLLNSAALAAAHATASATPRARRVLLLDWDVHHGNGTQRLTYNDPKILYMSIHRYDNGTFFPSSTEADHSAVGEGAGRGYNVNIPWNKRGMGDAEYMAAFTQIVLPIAYEYSPDLVIVSAGFDAAVGDPLGGCKVTPECFGRMTQLLRSLAGGRVILCLEGGYNVTSVSYSMAMCTKALLGDPIHHQYDPKVTVHSSTVDTINDVITTHKQYWKSLKFQVALPTEDVLDEPAPSRGLTDMNVLDSFAKMSISDKKCSDGVHCGTDDEDDSKTNEASGSIKEENKDNCDKKCADGVHCGTDDEDDSKDASGSKKEENKDSEPKTLVDYLSDNMEALVNGEMYAVVPLQWCPHLDSLYAIPESVTFKQGVKCADCEHTVENWVCLHCYTTACGRYVNGHLQAHAASHSHALALSLADLSVWCSVCDAYVDNALLYDAKNKAHRSKFGADMPWCYPDNVLQMK
ncbi:histone deacetylase 6 isoform X2 [Aricia agestis]|uniref:histone deacetylase 6 isoform X2 n=1 Tax=Aricia agestis TaxID=91739 RepID=UPI001C2051F9|nr:histone deacetylase 6 isoform X2 [Aricia agestis]